MHDKHQIIEEPCEVKVSRTVLKTSGIGDSLAEFNRTNELPRSKTERRRSNFWAFFQLRQFLLYKSVKFGVKLHLVDPRDTSKSCHCCGVIGNRQGKKFSCVNLACGWIGDADWNGSLNIQKLGQLINLPRDPSTLFCSLQDIVLRVAENSTLASRVG